MSDVGRCKECGLIWHVENNIVKDHYPSVFSKIRRNGLCPGSGKAPK